MMPNKKYLITPLLAALVLAGCANVPVSEPHALPATPAAFKNLPRTAEAAAPAAAPATQGQWWQIFADSRLDELMDRAMAHNTTVQAVAARLAQARAITRQTGSVRAPQVSIDASSGRQGGEYYKSIGQAGTLHQLRLDASYEVDLIGRLSKRTQAARLDEQAAQSLLANARLLVQADVAQTYFAIRAVDAERALMRETLAAYRDSLGLTERRYAAGDVAELDVARARTEVAANESLALALDRRRQELDTALAVLVGEVPSVMSLAEGSWSDSLPAVPAGLPSAILTRRPDIAAAQASYEAAQKRVDVAKTAWFPSLTLTAAAGGASSELSELLKSSASLWGLNALLSLPLLDGGRREAGIQSAAAQQDEAAAYYREQVLQAFKDVEDQLAGLTLLEAQQKAQAEAVNASERAMVLSDSRYRNGMVSQLELLDSRRTMLANRRQALQVKAAQFQATVALVKALGGGWSSS
ncbi:efflux transporter outer membrane subunit [Andreprevotia chitinilytica]|uniref:efflux transporter outer membrane subunit n=1 Tax=Andreprevotia chitinilytica TaxID=396808 RepID=UPI000554A649|nr:efflux transporter outer membrane subunit [Andreprevotia chitinilytica]